MLSGDNMACRLEDMHVPFKQPEPYCLEVDIQLTNWSDEKETKGMKGHVQFGSSALETS